MSTPSLSAYSVVPPVALGTRHPSGAFMLSGAIRGTAFAISRTHFLTAGHVAREIDESSDVGLVVLARPDGSNLKGVEIAEIEFLPGDVALLQLHYADPTWSARVTPVPWRRPQLQQFEPVRVIGFAYGLHEFGDGKKELVQRGFQGHVTSVLRRFTPQGSGLDPFKVYEVSFPAPRGLSGAPLLNTEGTLQCSGVLIGNSKSGMLVYSDEEILEEGAERTVVERYEYLTLGVVTHLDVLMPVHSGLLGNTIGEHLEAEGLVK